VLVRVAEVLTSQSREIDVVARFGGEEFVVLLPEADTEIAHKFAERVRALIAHDPEPLPPVRASAGVTAAVAPATIEPLVHGADTALYSAKRGGRDRTVSAEAPLRFSKEPSLLD
jgi:diguanylate cyclase (GGDEF)-like protein